MPQPDEQTALTTIGVYRRRGAYRLLADWYAGLPPELLARPAIALELAAARWRQGYVHEALRLLSTLDRASATAGQLAVATLETAGLEIYRDFSVRAAVEIARATLSQLERAAVSSAEWAAIRRSHSRILLIAAVVHEIGEEDARRIEDQLPEVADLLAGAGRLDESLAVRFTRVQRLPDVAEKLAAFAEISTLATAHGLHDVRGEVAIDRAELLISTGATQAAFEQELGVAEDAFRHAAHLHGLIDASRARRQVQVEQGLAGLEVLDACLAEYHAVDYPRAELSLLMTMAQLAIKRGNTNLAWAYNARSVQLAEAAGMRMVLEPALFAQADLLSRFGRYGSAIEMCRAALAGDLPPYRAAMYESLLSGAYTVLGDHTQAIQTARQAFAHYSTIGASAEASNAVAIVANQLLSTRRADMLDEAEALVSDWIQRDLQRNDLSSAVAKYEILAQLHLNRYLSSPSSKDATGYLSACEHALAEGTRLAPSLPQPEADQRLAVLRQVESGLLLAKGDRVAAERALREAADAFDRTGLLLQAANCRYLRGTIYAQAAAEQLTDALFQEAQSNVQRSLDYYRASDMRSQAADARFELARLYANASLQAPAAADQLLDAAVQHLRDAEADMDAIRRQFAVGNVLEAQEGKRLIEAKSRRVYELALVLLSQVRPDSSLAWQWCQRSKARALGDALGNGAIPPARMLTALSEHPESLALVQQEREVTDRLRRVGEAHRPPLRRQLDDIRTHMQADPHLSEYLALRVGTPITQADLRPALTPGGECAGGREAVAVDWYATGDTLWLVVCRSTGEPQLRRLSIDLAAVRAFIRRNLAPYSFRSTLTTAADLLRGLDPLIAPLGELTDPDEVLVLSPTGPLHALPLHALEVHGTPLIERNPIAYTPSLSTLRICRTRANDGLKPMPAAVLGDCDGDRPRAAQLVEDVSRVFGVRPILGRAVTRAAFVDALNQADLVHFQGHARYDATDPLESHLQLADGPLTARELFAVQESAVNLVALGACESAVSAIAAGDELLGLMPSFLHAGANAIVATLWPVAQSAAQLTMGEFYRILADRMLSTNKASAMRAALLHTRAAMPSPYDWTHQ